MLKSEMIKEISDEEIEEIFKVCYLNINLGMNYQEIAKYIGLSAPTVGRRIAEAKKRDWIKEKIEFNLPDHYNLNLIKPLPQKEEKILKLFPGLLDGIMVVPYSNAPGNEYDYVYRAAAKVLEKTEMKKLGVNWGRSTLGVAKKLNPSPSPNLKCIPICGEVGNPQLYEEARFLFSDEIASIIAEKFDASEPVIRVTFQSRLPAGLDPDSIKCIKSYIINYDYSYRQIFGDGEGCRGLIHELDTIISGIGAAESNATWLRYIASLENMKDEEFLEKLIKLDVVGDIAQHFVVRDGLPLDGEVAELNNRVIGLNPSHFIQIAKKYRESDKRIGLGVVVITTGKSESRLRSIIVAIRNKAINHLIIDEGLADMIIDEVEK